MTNPWDIDRLKTYLGEEESLQLDFKSSRDLATGNKNDANAFFRSLSADVSAFLNSEGGLLLVGVEEQDRKNQPDIATGLSKGVPRKVLTAQRFQDCICSNINPSVAAYVHVLPIVVGEQDGDKLQAFAIEVKRGTTAYQAADKKYYVRRGYSSDAMEDKDIRLRMLTDDRPRAEFVVALSSQSSRDTASRQLDDYLRAREAFEKQHGTDPSAWPSTSAEFIDLIGKLPKNWPSHSWEVWVTLAVRNSGNKTIREFFVEWGLTGISGVNIWDKPAKNANQDRIQFHFESNRERDGSTPIFPELTHSIGQFSVRCDLSSIASTMSLSLHAKGYLDDGRPFVYEEDIGNQLFGEFSRLSEFIQHIREHCAPPADTSI